MNPGRALRQEILSSVDQPGEADYPEVFLTSANGIVLGYRSGGILIWEEEGEVRKSLPGIDLEAAAGAWSALAENDLGTLEKLPWHPIGAPERES